MVIKGIVENGQVRIDVQGILPEGTAVLVTPVAIETIPTTDESTVPQAKASLQGIIDLPSKSPDDGFSGADHDQLLYGHG